MPSRWFVLVALAALAIPLVGVAQAPPPACLLEPARVYDGTVDARRLGRRRARAHDRGGRAADHA